MFPEYIHSEAAVMVCSPWDETKRIEQGSNGVGPKFFLARLGDIRSIVISHGGIVVSQEQYEPPIIAVWPVGGENTDTRACGAAVEVTDLLHEAARSIGPASGQFLFARVGIAAGACILQRERGRYSHVSGHAITRAGLLHDRASRGAEILVDEHFAGLCGRYEFEAVGERVRRMLGTSRGFCD